MIVCACVCVCVCVIVCLCLYVCVNVCVQAFLHEECFEILIGEKSEVFMVTC